MPPVDEAQYLIELWHEAGTIESSGMGISRLSWAEIGGWLKVREFKEEPPLTSWEIDTVRKLSEEYSSEYNLASQKDRPAPYEVEDTSQVDRVLVGNKVKNVLAGFKKNTKERFVVEEE